MNQLLFYTYADRAYSIFAIPYAYFALTHNPDAKVEIILENHAQFILDNSAGIKQIDKMFPGQAIFRQSETISSGIKSWPNTLRFIEPPRETADYVYIGDIDLLVMEDVCAVHMPLVEKYDLPFSNIIRPASLNTEHPQLTGLHFCSYDKMYPLEDISDLNLAALSDEHILYCLMKRRGYMVPSSFRERPECGIHMSLSRDPLGRCTGRKNKHYKAGKSLPWSGREYYRNLQKLFLDQNFRTIYHDFPFEFRCLFTVLESVILDKHRHLHRIASSFMIDRTIAFSDPEFTLVEQEKKMSTAIDICDLDEAERISAKINLLWPVDLTQWLKRSKVAIENKNNRVAIEALAHLCELEGGVAYLARQNITVDYESVLVADTKGVEILQRIDSWKSDEDNLSNN